MHQILELNPLERIIADTIKNVASEVRTFAEHKRKEMQYDPSLHFAENFISEYQDCKWKGTATDSLKDNIKEHLVCSYRKNAIKKLLGFVAMAGAGMLTASIGYMLNAPAIGITGDLIGLASVAATYISFRISREKTEKINYAIKNDSDSMNRVLRHIYDEERCH